MKDSLLLRDGQTPNADFKPDWGSWATVERTKVQDQAAGLDADDAAASFDPVITGPWMDLWDLETDCRDNGSGKPRPNAHIDRYLEQPEATKTLGDIQDKYKKHGNW